MSIKSPIKRPLKCPLHGRDVSMHARIEKFFSLFQVLLSFFLIMPSSSAAVYTRQGDNCSIFVSPDKNSVFTVVFVWTNTTSCWVLVQAKLLTWNSCESLWYLIVFFFSWCCYTNSLVCGCSRELSAVHFCKSVTQQIKVQTGRRRFCKRCIYSVLTA